MHQGRYVFAQLMQHLPLHVLQRAVKRYDGERYVKSFSCLDQFLCMAFAQLTGRDSLRDLEIALRTHQSKLYHLGIRSHVARSTLAEANEKRDWRIYADFAQHLIATARALHANDALDTDLGQAIYALDSTTIELCLSVYPWAKAAHAGRAAIKLHTLLDAQAAIPTAIYVSDGRWHDVNLLPHLVPEMGAIYLMDRGYLDLDQLYRLNCCGAFFLMRAKRHLRVKRSRSHPVKDRSVVLCDQTVRFVWRTSRIDYPIPLRRVRVRGEDAAGSIVLITNHFGLPATTVSELYRKRWQIEVFFKWIKQHLRIKSFLGTSANAVKTQIWIAVCVYVLIAIVRARLDSTARPYEILQVLSLTLFEKTPLNKLFSIASAHVPEDGTSNQLILFAD